MPQKKRHERLSNVIPPFVVSQMGKKVTCHETTNFQKIYADGKLYMRMPGENNSILNKCRNDVKKDGLNFIESGGFIPNLKLSYYAFHPSFYLPNVFRDFVQIDIKSAYWEIARKRNYISKSTYNKYIDYKKERNSSLGTWATQTVVTEYLKGEIISSEINKKETRKLFFACASECFKIMKDILHVSGAIREECFVWVDAIFIKKKYAKMVESAIFAKGFSNSYDEINIIVSDGSFLNIYMENKVKKFSLPANKINNFDKLQMY